MHLLKNKSFFYRLKFVQHQSLKEQEQKEKWMPRCCSCNCFMCIRQKKIHLLYCFLCFYDISKMFPFYEVMSFKFRILWFSIWNWIQQLILLIIFEMMWSSFSKWEKEAVLICAYNLKDYMHWLPFAKIK